MKESIEFMENYCDFSDPNFVWIMTGLSRNKDNDGNHHDCLHRLIIRNKEDVLYIYERLKGMMNNSDTVYRIYISLNARDIVKTLFTYQIKLLTISKNVALHENYDQLNRLDSVWKTELCQKGNRGTKRFLLDIDGSYEDNVIKNVVGYISSSCQTVIHACRKTKNGYAIVIDACDTRGFLEYLKKEEITVDVQHDSMVFVELFKGME